MSDPVRYDEVWGEWSGEPAGLAPTKDGDWVKWDDYAILKAKVEMLNKAGDEMAKHLGREYVPSWVENDWNEAKKGNYTE